MARQTRRRQRLAALAASMQQRAPRFSQAGFEALRETEDFKNSTIQFENLKRAISDRLSPRDIKPIVRAGAQEDKLLTQLAFVVDGSFYGKNLSRIVEKSQLLKQLAEKLERVADETTVLLCNPECDGRFWLAFEGQLSWDEVPQPGVLQFGVLRGMRALSQLLRSRGDALGELSRPLKKYHRNGDLRNLLAYLSLHTNGQSFDREIAYLLTAAYKAAGQKKVFTQDQIRKIRQRHLPKRHDSTVPTTIPTLGQRIASGFQTQISGTSRR